MFDILKDLEGVISFIREFVKEHKFKYEHFEQDIPFKDWKVSMLHIDIYFIYNQERDISLTFMYTDSAKVTRFFIVKRMKPPIYEDPEPIKDIAEISSSKYYLMNLDNIRQEPFEGSYFFEIKSV